VGEFLDQKRLPGTWWEKEPGIKLGEYMSSAGKRGIEGRKHGKDEKVV